MKEYSDIKKEVDKYYSTKIRAHGATSKGVDWNGEESQYIRFHTLAKVILKNNFSILDYGCGYGEFVRYLINTNYKWNYHGYDISEAMIDSAKKLFSEYTDNFSKDINFKNTYDYTIASGIFNVRNKINNEEWLEYILSELHAMNNLTTEGFSFNALTSYSDEEFKKDYLYYADPLFLFNYCKKHFSRNVALLHDYDLYEFTIIIRK